MDDRTPTPGPAPKDVRWSHYRTAIVEVEPIPGQWVTLNGPTAASEWLLPSPVFVITGWNPGGVVLSDGEHELANRRIATRIIDLGGRFLHGHGRSPSGDHAEPSLVAWGVTLEQALELGTAEQQDAIFELTGDEVILHSCIDDHVERWSRLA